MYRWLDVVDDAEKCGVTRLQHAVQTDEAK